MDDIVADARPAGAAGIDRRIVGLFLGDPLGLVQSLVEVLADGLHVVLVDRAALEQAVGIRLEIDALDLMSE